LAVAVVVAVQCGPVRRPHSDTRSVEFAPAPMDVCRHWLLRIGAVTGAEICCAGFASERIGSPL
jgi:hypothetical protein